MTAKELILERLAHTEIPLALHQFQLPAVSQTSISARLRELAREGLVESVPIKGRKYTAWKLVEVSDYQWDQQFLKI